MLFDAFPDLNMYKYLSSGRGAQEKSNGAEWEKQSNSMLKDENV